MHAQRGVGLVELLVGLVVGTFLMLGVTSYFVQSKGTYSYQQAQANQQQHERIIASLLGTNLRQAGYAPLDGARVMGVENWYPNDGGDFAMGQAVFGTQGGQNVTVNGVTGAQPFPDDTISVRFVGDAGITRCDGTTPAVNALVTDTYSTDGVRFVCTTDGGDTTLFGGVAVPENQQLRVLGMQVRYGVDTDGDEAIDSIVRANNVGSWADVRVADIEVHFQAATRPPQANSFVIVFENVLGVDLL